MSIQWHVTRAGRRLPRILPAAALVAAASFLGFGTAEAQVQQQVQMNAGKLYRPDGTEMCTITGFTFDQASGALRVAGCLDEKPKDGGGKPCDAATAGKFSFTQATNVDAPAGSTTTTVTITRSYNLVGSCALTWSVSASNGATASVGGQTSGTITFADADYAAKTLQVTTAGGSAAGQVVVTLGAGTGTPPELIWPFNTQTWNVAALGGNGCPTAATHNGTFTLPNQKVTFALKAGETGAVAFTPTAGSVAMTLSTTDTVNTPAGADHEVTISRCPGDFSDQVAAQCRYQSQYTGSTRWASVSPTAPYQCPLTAGQTYFMNVRQVVMGSNPPVNSCSGGPAILGGACEVRLQNTGL